MDKMMNRRIPPRLKKFYGKIHSDEINSFFIDAIERMDKIKLLDLPPTEMSSKLARHELKRFVLTSTLDQKLYYLTRLGFEFAIIIHDKEKGEDVKTLEALLYPEKHQMAFEEQRGRIFFLSNTILWKQVMKASLFFNSKLYGIHKIVTALKFGKWKDERDQDSMEREKVKTLLLRCLQGSYSIDKYLIAIGLQQTQFMILVEMYLSVIPTTAKGMASIMSDKYGFLVGKTALAGLERQGYIEKVEGSIGRDSGRPLTEGMIVKNAGKNYKYLYLKKRTAGAYIISTRGQELIDKIFEKFASIIV